MPHNVPTAVCLPCPAFEISHEIPVNITNATNFKNSSNATFCDCVDPFDKPECKMEQTREGVYVGLARKNTTADIPVFRFDGKFVCSVMYMTAGGHHTCLIFGEDATLPPVLERFLHITLYLMSRATQCMEQGMKHARIATLVTWSASVGMTTTRLKCHSVSTAGQ